MMEISKWNNPMLPVLKVLRILGRTPFTVNDSGRLECHPVSFASAWVLLSTAAQTLLVAKVHILYLLDPSYWGSFDGVVAAASEVSYLDCALHSITTTWWATPAIVRAYNKWSDFYEVLEARTGRTTAPTVIDHLDVGVFAVCIGIGIVTLFGDTVLKYDGVQDVEYDVYEYRVSQCAIYFLMAFYLLAFLSLWIVFCVMVKNAADIIRESFSESTSGSLDLTVSELRLLWLELHSCTVTFTRSVGRTMALWLLEILYDYIITVYTVMVFISEPIEILVYETIVTVIVDTFCMFMMFFIGSWATKSIHDSMIRTLYGECWTEFSDSEYFEMELFVDAVETGKPYFEILGILTIEKVEYLSILQTIITYLVVLVQFKQLSPETKNMTSVQDEKSV